MTQVISPTDAYVHHDRLTHSLKVAQVSQALAKSLGERVDVDVVHAAALAHDIGHPPFGHAAEDELMGILDGRIDRFGAPISAEKISAILPDSFEGNAQSFRIVARTAARKWEERDHGLNLRYRTLAAILKYPWQRGQQPAEYSGLENRKWGAYHSESVELKLALEIAAATGVMGTHRSVEADIMDWADDVSYAVHDTEDFFRAGLIPLDALRTNDTLWDGFLTYASDSIRARRVQDWAFNKTIFDAVSVAVRDRLPRRPYLGDFESREDLHLFGSDSIRALLRGIAINSNGDLEISIEQRTRVELLKKLTRYFVIEQPDLYFSQKGQRAVVRELFWDLWDMAQASKLGRKSVPLPARFADYCDLALRSSSVDGYDSSPQRLARATVDFICSLTDGQALNMRNQIRNGGQPPNARVASI
ncbi:dGTPase [Glaciihabitans sp. UYNi722]